MQGDGYSHKTFLKTTNPLLDRCNRQCANLTAVGSDVNILDKRSSPKYTEITVPIFHIIKNGNGVMC